MKIYGHPWSLNTRKTLLTLAEKEHEAELVLLMIPRGEHKQPEHLDRHPFGKVPVLDDAGFVLYETRAINAYLDRKLPGPSLTPSEPQAEARLEQWIDIAAAYFIPHAHPLLIETLFRRYLGGEPQLETIERTRREMQPALDAAERRLAENAYLGGAEFSRADIHWMPYFEYLVQTGQGELLFSRRPHLSAWWERASSRRSWQRVARSGPQAYEPGMSAEVIEKLHRR